MIVLQLLSTEVDALLLALRKAKANPTTTDKQRTQFRYLKDLILFAGADKREHERHRHWARRKHGYDRTPEEDHRGYQAAECEIQGGTPRLFPTVDEA